MGVIIPMGLRTSEPKVVTMLSKLLNSREAAKFLCINQRTLQNWLSTKRHPGLKFIKLGGARKFREEDLIEFIDWTFITGNGKANVSWKPTDLAIRNFLLLTHIAMDEALRSVFL
jgi:hypothetical protein